MAAQQMFRNSQLVSHAPDLVLEEVAQRFHQLEAQLRLRRRPGRQNAGGVVGSPTWVNIPSMIGGSRMKAMTRISAWHLGQTSGSTS